DLPMLLGSVMSDIIDLYNPHYVLVDSRSGFAEMASAPILKADRLVCVLRPNRQNADGLRMLLDILDTYGKRPNTFMILSQVPDIPEASEKIEKLQSILGPNRKFDAVVPFVPELAIEETVIALSEPDSFLAQCYRPIADWLET